MQENMEKLRTAQTRTKNPMSMQQHQHSLCCILWGNFACWRSPQGKGSFISLPWESRSQHNESTRPVPAKSLVQVQVDPCWQIWPRSRRGEKIRCKQVLLILPPSEPNLPTLIAAFPHPVSLAGTYLLQHALFPALAPVVRCRSSHREA